MRWGIQSVVFRGRAIVLERIIRRAPDIIDPSIGQTPAQALTFTTLKGRMVEAYLEYVHVQETDPGRLCVN